MDGEQASDREQDEPAKMKLKTEHKTKVESEEEKSQSNLATTCHDESTKRKLKSEHETKVESEEEKSKIDLTTSCQDEPAKKKLKTEHEANVGPEEERSQSDLTTVCQNEPAKKRLKTEHEAKVEKEEEKSQSDLMATCQDVNKSSTSVSTQDKSNDLNEITEPKKLNDVTESVPDQPTREDQDEGRAGLVTEMQVGLSQYLGAHNGFSAVIKQRYSDFIVNEIDQDGNVVRLTDLTYHDLDEEKQNGNDTGTNNQQDDTTSVLSEEDEKKLLELVEKADKSEHLDIVVPDDKELRTKIHLSVKNRFTQLETKTTEDDAGRKVIQVFWKKGKARDLRRDEWPKTKKSCRYIRFVLYKENKDTMDAIGLIAKNLKVKENMFQYAGTKDKRGKTSQEITAHRIHPKKLVVLNKVLWNMGLGNFRYVQEPLKLGQLKGNRFVIVLRNVQGDKEAIEQGLASLQSNGFVNYFGMQRFGTSSIPTYTIGRALLHGEWDKAINLILMPRQDKACKAEFQKVWEDTHDASETLKVVPRYCGLERNLLQALSRRMKPFDALEKISRNTRLIYVHSYQSLVWNLMASKRLQEMGDKPVPGDLVMRKHDSETDSHFHPEVVTEENHGEFRLEDVVLPLPGHDVLYPQNKVHSWYKEQLAADGLDIDKMKRSHKDYSLPGAYRHIVVRPSDMSWAHHRYDDYTEPLTLSDMDVVKGESLPDPKSRGDKYAALVLSLSLPTSCYATMALRELMKADTSVTHQTSLNVT